MIGLSTCIRLRLLESRLPRLLPRLLLPLLFLFAPLSCLPASFSAGPLAGSGCLLLMLRLRLARAASTARLRLRHRLRLRLRAAQLPAPFA